MLCGLVKRIVGLVPVIRDLPDRLDRIGADAEALIEQMIEEGKL